ncbi:hypothetical protein V8C42DRAFT_338168, partial [Trichoderma barbatum]
WCGYVHGKGKVADFISAQPPNPMVWTVLTSFPLGEGKCLIYLEDYGHYARWILDNPSRSSGIQLHVATEDMSWKDLAAALPRVTDKKAVYKDLSLDQYFKLPIFSNPDMIVGHSTNGENLTLLTFRKNFSGFGDMWKDNLTKRDYELLDEILPTRVKSVQEWMEKTAYTGNLSPVLKDHRDGS